MIRFDANCVLGRWPDGGPTLDDADQMLAAMDRLHISKALVRHTLGGQYDVAYGNALLTQQIADRERLLPCWAALPAITGETGPSQEWLDSLAKNNVRAVCLYPASHGYPLAGWQCDALLAPLAERRYLLLLESAEIDWEGLHWLCESYAQLRVVLMNLGYRVLRPIYALLDVHPNLHLDISTLSSFMGIEALGARFGAERLLFGTGQPRNEGASTVAALNYAAMDGALVQAIASGNLESLLGEVQL